MCDCRSEKKFVKFTEHNDWEGETWHHYLPVEGNEVGLLRLTTLIEELDPDGEEFELDLDNPLPEWKVDVLVENTDVGYIAYHTKVTGRMWDFERHDVVDRDWSDLEILQLGKGDVTRLFTEED